MDTDEEESHALPLISIHHYCTFGPIVFQWGSRFAGQMELPRLCEVAVSLNRNDLIELLTELHTRILMGWNLL